MDGTEWAMLFGTLTLTCWMAGGLVGVILSPNEFRNKEIGKGLFAAFAEKHDLLAPETNMIAASRLRRDQANDPRGLSLRLLRYRFEAGPRASAGNARANSIDEVQSARKELDRRYGI